MWNEVNLLGLRIEGRPFWTGLLALEPAKEEFPEYLSGFDLLFHGLEKEMWLKHERSIYFGYDCVAQWKYFIIYRDKFLKARISEQKKTGIASNHLQKLASVTTSTRAQH